MNDEIANKQFAERLNQAFDLRNYPSHGRGRVNYIQEIFNISRAGANKWIHGKAIPHPQKRGEIAQKLGISLDWLETGEGSPLDRNEENFEADNLTHKIPLLTMQQAYNIETAINSNEIEKLIVNNTIPLNAIAINFVGNSMQPRFQEPSILIMTPGVPVTDGDYVIAKTIMLPEALFRQYVKGSSGAYLVALNPKFEPVKLDESSDIIGKVIEVRSNL